MGHYASEMGERRPTSGPIMTEQEECAWRSEAFAKIGAAKEIENSLGIKLSCNDKRVLAYLNEKRRCAPELEPLVAALRDAERNLRSRALESVFGFPVHDSATATPRRPETPAPLPMED